MKRAFRSAGFGVVELLLMVVIIVLVGLAGWVAHERLVAKSKSATSSTTDTTASKGLADPYSGWKTYANADGGVTFKYPTNWSSQVGQEVKYDDGSFGGVSGTLASPSGHKLTWVYNVVGGKDSPACTPRAGEVPFAKGNTCDSKQILSVEQLPSVKPTTSTLRNLFEDRLYITETKYQQGTFSGAHGYAATYQICLDPYFNGEAELFPKVGTQMGFELPCNYRSTGLNVEFFANSQADLNSPDAQTAKLIMRSFSTV